MAPSEPPANAPSIAIPIVTAAPHIISLGGVTSSSDGSVVAR